MYKGIDVSERQGTIDWKKVKKAGCRFAVLRSIKWDGKPDSQFWANAKGCYANDIPYSIYRYTYAVLPTEALEEAEQVIRLLRSRGKRSCRIWWDVEDKSLEPLGRDVLTGLIKTAENTITGAGYEFGIYTGQFFYDGGFFDAGAFDCPMWVARYPVSRSFVFDENPPSDKYRPEIKQPLFAWQYTSKGRIDGIDSLVDLDICYLPFG
ncbi:GH25 family lysozyme [Eisenbergiella porci]|uniref:GH25 family lysozyme n=1 Tax=Eisenbergiella porci TaxID=2652274 RepID=UPI002A815777|nr:GH25 family lysozyme [Eisenbergiella porci]